MTSQTPEELDSDLAGALEDELAKQFPSRIGDGYIDGDVDAFMTALAPSLAAIRRHAAAQALEEAAQDFEDNIGVGEFDELARRDGARWTHIDDAWEYQGPYMDWLRARAAIIRAD